MPDVSATCVCVRIQESEAAAEEEGGRKDRLRGGE